MSIIEKALDRLDTNSVDKKTSKQKTKSAVEDSKKSSLQATKKSDRPPQSEKQQHSKLVNIDLEELTELGYLTPDSKNKILFEQYRRIKMPILQKAMDESLGQNKNIIMVTSSVEGEGKSFTSVNLAMSIAYEYNHTVLLIDADVTKKMMSNIFSIENEKGLIDYLSDDSLSLPDLILKTNIPKLSLLPSGSGSERVTELYNSHKMGNLAKELASRYNDRIIIFDTPPMLQDSSSEAIKNIIHQILFVIEAEKTAQHMVEKALTILSDASDIGLVLNKSNQRTNPSYYYSY